MFIGEYRHNLDQKGRLAIPAKFRGKLADGCVVTRGVDRCLVIYPSKVWEKMAHKLARLPLTQKEARAFSRLLLSGAMSFELDGQGRITIPEFLRKYAGLKKKVVVVGLYDRLEVWDEKNWEEFRKKAEKEAENLAEKLTELGL
ncbi:division/cell wall cluster transcriptional repressor MraZ [bacterium]|nr:division/cell wall cluster transcriptional repressor MraZ [bacterium]